MTNIPHWAYELARRCETERKTPSQLDDEMIECKWSDLSTGALVIYGNPGRMFSAVYSDKDHPDPMTRRASRVWKIKF